MKKYKFAFFELEILLVGYQVIPPSATICKITKVKGYPSAFKTDKPFYEINETEDCERHGKVRAPIKFEIALAERGVGADKWIDLLFNVIKTSATPRGSKLSAGTCGFR